MRIIVVVVGLVLIAAGTLVGVARLTSHSIDGIHCDFLEASGYHVHAHLTIIRNGHITYPPANVGIRPEHLCLYWLHTHDGSGIIHIESPRHISPTLRSFFEIWGQPLTHHAIWTYRLREREQVRVYMGHRRVSGDPGLILLHKHTTVTIEIGPRFVPPPAVHFGGL